MKSKFKKIGIFGTSGTGKTTLARFISEEYELPYLNSSSSKLWDRYGYKNHGDVVEDARKYPNVAVGLQHDILELRRGMLMCKEYFVTDRTPLDQLAYYLIYFTSFPVLTKIAFIERLVEQAKSFDAFIFIRFNQDTIEDNQIRIQDPFYQLQIDYTMLMLKEKNVLNINVPILELDKWHWLDRVDKTRNFLKT